MNQLSDEPTKTPTQRLPEAGAVDAIYKTDNSFIKKLILATLGAFFLAFLLNYPIQKNFLTLIENQIAKQRQCPISYQNISMGWLLPKIVMDEALIPGQCFGQVGKNLIFDKVLFRLSMPSFWPIGIKTKLEAHSEKATINVYPRLAIGGNAIQIENTSFTGPFISQFTPFPNLLKGNITAQGHFELSGQSLDTGHLKLSSNDLIIPPQNIMGISLSSMPIRKFEAAATYAKKTLHIKALRLGNSQSPLQAEFRGKINISPQNISFSRLSLEGKVRFSDSFLNQISLLRIMLNGKKQKDGFYFLRLSGTMAAPIPKFIDPQ